MASQELLDKLNKAIAREIQVSVQYMWQHVQAIGLESPPVREIFKKIAIVEMKHAEEIAERLCDLGGVPTTKPEKITIGKELKEMLELDLKAEEEAVATYKDIIKHAHKEEDFTTAHLFTRILSEEEEHVSEFKCLLGI
ncbi:bacterioferritin [Acidobacteriota bacterium]